MKIPRFFWISLVALLLPGSAPMASLKGDSTAALRPVQSVSDSASRSLTPGPLTLGPSALGPSALGPSTLGPSALGPSTPGPLTFGPSALGPSTLRPPLPPAAIAGWDSQRQVPTFLWAAGNGSMVPPEALGSPRDAARWYLQQHAAYYRLSSAALKTVVVRHIHDTGRGGIIVRFGQRLDGIDVVPDSLTVLMTRRLELVAITGNLHAAAVGEEGCCGGSDSTEWGGSSTGSPSEIARLAPGFSLSEAAAAAGAFADLTGIRTAPLDWSDAGPGRGGYRFFEVALTPETAFAPLELVRPARIKKVFYALPDRLVPAYYLELAFGPRGDRDALLYAYVLEAKDGEVLARQKLTDDEAITFRVWAEETGDLRPLYGPIEDYLPHPTGNNDGSYPDYVDSVLLTIDAFNANPDGGADSWLPADAFETSGNNVDAYSDYYSPDGFSDGDMRAPMNGERLFDYVYDTAQEPLVSEEQTMAAITQLFFTTNWLHDWYYDSGFTESAGNAQVDNLGRGGIEGDPLHAEAQDNALDPDYRNNANMNTPADGGSPRMQMYLWSGRIEASVTLKSTGESLEAGYAKFGPDEFDLTGRLIRVQDELEPYGDFCEPATNDISGRIVLVDRGLCKFQDKALNAQDEGAIGIVVVNNEEGNAPSMSEVYPDLEVTIPILSITLEDGLTLDAALQSGLTVVTMFRTTDVERDGSLDNSVVAHEWGHYLFRRLAPWCWSQQCRAMSEGWSDIIALHMSYEEGDDPEGAYAHAIYAKGGKENAAYFGSRRVPYSIDFAKNSLSFRHIQDGEPLPTDIELQDNGLDNSEVHNAGEIWATMAWEAYMALVGRTLEPDPAYDYEAARRRMGDYIVAGMALAPNEATFTEMRDALLAAAAASDPDDHMFMAEAFARRGAGSCAEAPPRESSDLVGVVEDFTVAPYLNLVSIKLDDSIVSCDNDGALDAGETGRLEIGLYNSGSKTLTDARASVASTLPGVGFPGGSSVGFETIEPKEMAYVSLEVSLDKDLTDVVYVDLSVKVKSPSACNGSVTADVSKLANYDEELASSTLETVEGDLSVWSVETVMGTTDVWSREPFSTTNYVFHGNDSGSLNDSRLVSPEIQVSTDTPFVVRLEHRYQFEASEHDGEWVLWDGGVIEITEDGWSWTDVAEYTDPGYDGVLSNLASNPLSDREAFADQSSSWPDMEPLELDFGDQFAGKTVRFRFRIGADQAASAFGWELDNISLSGVVNTPFSTVMTDAGELGIYYRDEDGDGFGGGGDIVQACVIPVGYSESGDDCDDLTADTYPGADEICDGETDSESPGGRDNDCDGEVDEDPVDGLESFVDVDGDGYGTGQAVVTCAIPEGYVRSGDDCDDSDAGTYPGADERCDTLDNDCDCVGAGEDCVPEVDEGPVDGTAYYLDADADGEGEGAPVYSCVALEGYTTNDLDCDDEDPSTNTGADEVCDGLDNDCDCAGAGGDCVPEVDEGAVDAVVFYRDADGDGFGDEGDSILACDAPPGYLGQAGDCDDSSALTYPGAEEICDEADNDCDAGEPEGGIDEGATDALSFYLDGDGDGYGGGEEVEACAQPEGAATSGDDCDDSDPASYPGADESGADGKDHNCDGVVEQLPTPTPVGDDDVSPGDDDTPAGDDDAQVGDDDATVGDDDATVGDDDASVGDDDASSGDDDSQTGDDDGSVQGEESPAPADESGEGSCTCAHPGGSSGSSRWPGVGQGVVFVVAGVWMRRRRRAGWGGWGLFR